MSGRAVPRAARRLAAALLGVILFAGACSSDDTPAAAEPVDPFDIAPSDGVVERTLAGPFELEVSGAVAGRSENSLVAVHVLTSVGGIAPESAWFVTVGLLDPVEIGDGWKVRPSFDLVGYRGDGSYEIPPHGTSAIGTDPDDPTSGAIESDASLVMSRGDGQPVRHNVLIEPCTVEVADKAERGSITCPRVEGPDGEISYQWRWETDEVLDQKQYGDPAGDDGGGAGSPSGGTGPSDGGTGGPTPGSAGDGAGTVPDGSDGGGSDQSDEGSMSLEVSMSDTCLNRGSPVTITIVAEPRSAVAMAMAFSDAQTHGLQKIGTAGDDGRFVWQVVVPPEAPEGEGHLLVSASSEDGERAGKHIEPFEVRLTPC